MKRHPRNRAPFLTVMSRLELLAKEGISVAPQFANAHGVRWTWTRATSDSGGESGDTFPHLEDALADAERQLSDQAKDWLRSQVVFCRKEQPR